MPNTYTRAINRGIACLPRGIASRFASTLATTAVLIWATHCDDAGTTDLTIETFAQTYDAAFCDYLVRCNAMPDLATCKRVVGPDPNLIQALNSTLYGNLSFDEAGAGECIDAVKSATCASVSGFGKAIREVCGKAFANKGKAQTPCFVDLECEDGLECDTDPACKDACCPGKCSNSQTGVPIGDDCSMAPCVADAFCSMEGMMRTCKKRAEASERCNNAAECADGLTCDNGSKTCFKQSRTGQQCNPDLANNPCLNANEVCDPASSRCANLPKAGQACVASGPMMNSCSSYAVCVDGTCQKKPDVGDPCPGGGCIGNLQCQPPGNNLDPLCSPLGATVSCVLN